MNYDGDGTPRTPIHKKVTSNTKQCIRKLKKFLHGIDINELPIDFIGTIYFADLYILDSILGAGSFGVVLKVVERATGEEFAMKVIAII